MSLMNFSEILLRVVATILVMLIMARLNGPKQIAQMSFYDYVTGISVGSIAATISINTDLSLTSGLFAIILFFAGNLLLNKITQINLIANAVLTGKPIALIEKGSIKISGLQQSKMTVSELLSNLRTSGYFNINDVYTANLEPTGKLSVQPKGFARPARNDDLQLKAANPIQVLSVIMDGVILQSNLKLMNIDEKWLVRELRKQNIDEAELDQIILAVVDENHKLTVYNQA